jgi:hypothetical protein
MAKSKEYTIKDIDFLHIRVSEIKAEIVAIDYGYIDMLDSNETVSDRLLHLSAELINIVDVLLNAR